MYNESVFKNRNIRADKYHVDPWREGSCRTRQDAKRSAKGTLAAAGEGHGHAVGLATAGRPRSSAVACRLASVTWCVVFWKWLCHSRNDVGSSRGARIPLPVAAEQCAAVGTRTFALSIHPLTGVGVVSSSVPYD